MNIKDIPRDSDGRLPSYAWPGGYQMIYATKDGGELCPACANGENGSLATDANLDPTCPDDAQWLIVDGSTYDEGPPISCDHCARLIESSYGDPEQEND